MLRNIAKLLANEDGFGAEGTVYRISFLSAQGWNIRAYSWHDTIHVYSISHLA